MRKILFFLLIVTNLGVFSQLRNKPNLVNSAIENSSQSMTIPINQIYGMNVPPDTSRRVPGLTSWWDYWTNGNNQRMVVVLGDTVIVANPLSDSSNAQVSNGRKLFYQVSYNGGLTWLSSAIQWTLQGNAYPDVWPIILSGSRTIAISGREFTPSSRGHAGSDVILGAGSVVTVLVPVVGADYFTWPIGGNQLAGCYQSGDSLFFRRFNYSTNTYDARQIVALPPAEIDANGRKMVAASSDGQRVFVMWWVSTAGTERLVGKLSTDGGNTFGSIVTVMQNGYTLGGDVMYPWFGDDLIFKPNSTNYGAAFCTQPVGNSFREFKILYWSPSVNGGNPVKVADWANTPYLSDTMWAYNGTQNIQVGMTYISHPSIAYSSDGSRLACVFSVAQRDSVQYPTNESYLFNDIMVSYSNDDGATWSAPVKVTNTADVDEIYPVLSKYGNTPGNFGLLFQRSSYPGSSSFNQTTTPISRNWPVYTRIDPVTGAELPIGIKTISTEVPKSFSIEQNYPNPFNPSTKIRFNIVTKSEVTIRVYNTLGEVVEVLVNNQSVQPGKHEITFSGLNYSSGVYFYSISAGSFTETKKMILIK